MGEQWANVDCEHGLLVLGMRGALMMDEADLDDAIGCLEGLFELCEFGQLELDQTEHAQELAIVLEDLVAQERDVVPPECG